MNQLRRAESDGCARDQTPVAPIVIGLETEQACRLSLCRVGQLSDGVRLSLEISAETPLVDTPVPVQLEALPNRLRAAQRGHGNVFDPVRDQCR